MFRHVAETPGRADNRASAIASAVIVLCGFIYLAVFMFWLPTAQQKAQVGAIESYMASPFARQIMNLTQIIAGPAVIVATLGIYKRFKRVTKWARVGKRLGVSYGALMLLHGLYLLVFGVLVLHAALDAKAMQLAKQISLLPSPFDPMGFSKYGLAGGWFILTGVLSLRERAFSLWICGAAIFCGIGLLTLFIVNGIGLDGWVLAIGMGGAMLVAPLFWLGLAFRFLHSEEKMSARRGSSFPASLSFTGGCS